MIRTKKSVFLLLLLYLGMHNLQAQQRVVSGKVTDSDGQDLPGANVLIKNTNKGTITDHEGVYEIMVSGPSDTLNFSFIGFRE